MAMVNVRSKGATGNGVTNDLPYIMDAAHDAASVGAVLFFPSGIYKCPTYPDIPDGIPAVIGSGRLATTILSDDPTGLGMRFFGRKAMTIAGFAIRGTQVARASTSVGLYLANCTGMLVTDLLIGNPLVEGVHGGAGVSSGMFISGTIHSTLVGNFVRDTWADGYQVGGGSYDVTLKGNHAFNTGDDCFSTTDTGAGSVPSPSTMFRVNLIGNIAEQSYAAGYGIHGASDVNMVSNQAYNTLANGIMIDSQGSYAARSPRNVRAITNILRDCGRFTGAGAYSGIMVRGDSGSGLIRLAENAIINPSRSAVDVQGPGVATVGNDIDMQNGTSVAIQYGTAGTPLALCDDAVINYNVIPNAPQGAVSVATDRVTNAKRLQLIGNEVPNPNTSHTANIDIFSIFGVDYVMCANNLVDAGAGTWARTLFQFNTCNHVDFGQQRMTPNDLAPGNDWVNFATCTDVMKADLQVNAVPNTTTWRVGQTAWDPVTFKLYKFTGSAWKSVTLA